MFLLQFWGMGSGMKCATTFRLLLKWMLTHHVLEWMCTLLFRHWHLTLFESTCHKFMQCRGQSMPNGVIKGTGQRWNSQFWVKVNKKWDLLLEKVEVISYSVIPFNQFLPPNTTLNLLTVIFHSPPGPDRAALIPWGSTQIHGGRLSKKIRPVRRLGWGMVMGMVMEILLQMLGQNVHKM